MMSNKVTAIHTFLGAILGISTTQCNKRVDDEC